MIDIGPCLLHKSLEILFHWCLIFEDENDLFIGDTDGKANAAMKGPQYSDISYGFEVPSSQVQLNVEKREPGEFKLLNL